MLSAIILFGLALTGADADHIFAWPQGQRTAVSLSYDDGLASQLDNALPVLERHGLRASFYPTLASPVLASRIDEWRAAAASGHELGNHSIYHPCSASKPGNDWVKPYNDLDTMQIEQVRQELALANRLLHIIDGQDQRTFTTPCGDTMTADGDYLASVRDLFVAVKMDTASLPDGFSALIVADGHSGEELIEAVVAAGQSHRLVNVIFHGIGGDHIAVSSQAHEELVAYLADHADRYWTDTYLTIARYAMERMTP